MIKACVLIICDLFDLFINTILSCYFPFGINGIMEYELIISFSCFSYYFKINVIDFVIKKNKMRKLENKTNIPWKSRKVNPQKLTQLLSSRSHPRHLVGKRTAQKDTIIDITSDSQVNSNFPYRWSPASLTFNNYFYLFLYLYLT